MKAGRIVRIVALTATAVTCVVLARRLDHHRIAAAFAAVDWGWVAAAAAINLANTFVEAVRWSLLASPLVPVTGDGARRIRVGSTFLAIVSGVAGGLMLPFKLGDGVKAYVFAKANRLTLGQSVGSVVADRLTDVLAFSVIALVVSFTIPLPGPVGRAIHVASAGLAVLLALVVGLAATRRLHTWLLADGRPRLARLLGRGLRSLAGFGHGIPVARVGAAAIVSWMIRAAVVWAMMRAFHLPLPLVAAVVTLVVVNVGISVTGVPGNVGSFELSTVGALELYSVSPELAVSYAIALHATELLPVLAIGAVLALSGTIDFAGLSAAVAAPQPTRDN